jgi:chorismate dehydratase
MLYGDQRSQVDVSFSLPSVCAQQVEQGTIDIGIVPVAEIARQQLEVVPGVGIACNGPVRSILLLSRVPWRQVRVLAADTSSRTSVQLARVILRERYAVEPTIYAQAPILDQMLADADAALIIGDPALQIEPADHPFEWLDLGAEWLSLTGLPMVFAAWAGKPGIQTETLESLTRGSYEFGMSHMDEIIDSEHHRRGVTKELAEQYLREFLSYELGPKEYQGLQAFWELSGLTKRTDI